MAIVLDEHEWAREMISSSSMGKKPVETLCRVARYYIDDGCSKKEVRKRIENFLLKCEQSVSLTKWSDTIDYVIARAIKTPAINIKYIGITDAELKKIGELSSKQMQRLAVTLLALAKYWNAVNPSSDFWVNTKDSDIMRMANINTSIKRQSQMYHILGELGMLQFSKKVDNTNVRVLFAEDGDPVWRITDFRNIGYQYNMYCGSPEYIQCQSCGIVVKKAPLSHGASEHHTGRPQKYCKDCASEIRIRQSVNSVMRRRSSVNSQILG